MHTHAKFVNYFDVKQVRIKQVGVKQVGVKQVGIRPVKKFITSTGLLGS